MLCTGRRITKKHTEESLEIWTVPLLYLFSMPSFQVNILLINSFFTFINRCFFLQSIDGLKFFIQISRQCPWQFSPNCYRLYDFSLSVFISQWLLFLILTHWFVDLFVSSYVLVNMIINHHHHNPSLYTSIMVSKFGYYAIMWWGEAYELLLLYILFENIFCYLANILVICYVR